MTSTKSPFPRLHGRVASSNPYWKYCIDRYALPSGEERDYHFMQSPGSVLVLPMLQDGSFLLVRQFRYIQQKWGFEFPGGGKKSHLSSQENAQEELREEVGYQANNWSLLGSFSPCVGLLDEYCDVYLAQDLSAAEWSPEDSELIEIVTLTESQVDEAIARGEMWSGMSQVVWLQYKLWASKQQK